MGVMKKLLVWSLAIVILLFVSGFLFVTLSPVFGGKPDEQTRARMLASDNFKDDIFVNRHPVSDNPDSAKPPMGNCRILLHSKHRRLPGSDTPPFLSTPVQ